MILAGLLPYAIVAILMTKRARVQVPLCENHKGHWFLRNLFIWGGLLAVGAIVGGVGGAGLARRMGRTVVRRIILGIGFGMAFALLVKAL